MTGTNLGDGNNEIMIRKIRIHGNFAEHIPLLLFIMMLFEMQSVSAHVLTLMSVAIILGRLLHFYGLYSPSALGSARVWVCS